MTAFVSKQPVKVAIPDRPEEWIEIRAKLSVGDRGRLMDALLSVGQDSSVEMHAGRYLAAMLEAGVCGWHLLDGDGQAVPFRHDLVKDLDPDDPLVDKALAEIVARNPTLARANP